MNNKKNKSEIIIRWKKLLVIIALPKFANKIIVLKHPAQLANKNFLAEKSVALVKIITQEKGKTGMAFKRKIIMKLGFGTLNFIILFNKFWFRKKYLLINNDRKEPKEEAKNT